MLEKIKKIWNSKSHKIAVVFLTQSEAGFGTGSYPYNTILLHKENGKYTLPEAQKGEGVEDILEWILDMPDYLSIELGIHDSRGRRNEIYGVIVPSYVWDMEYLDRDVDFFHLNQLPHKNEFVDGKYMSVIIDAMKNFQ